MTVAPDRGRRRPTHSASSTWPSDDDRASDDRADVAIVGLGPAGAVLANLCGLAGLRTIVYERSLEAHPDPRAVHLDAEIARILQQCGFEAHLEQLLTVSAGMEYVDTAGDHLFTFEGFERAPLLGWHEDYVFHQPDLDRMLRSGLDRFDHVDVRLGDPAPPVDQLTGSARYVVGCDGASSGIREQLGIGLVDRGYDEEWLVVDLVLRDDATIDLPPIIQQVCDPARLATYVPGHSPHHRFEFRIDHADDPLPPTWDLVAPWGFTEDNANLVRAASYRFHALMADSWRDGSVFLAGDAAHQMPPFMGQGLCSGVRDVANLAWKLVAACAGDQGSFDDIEALLDSYEAERRPHVDAVIELSIQAGRLLTRFADDLAAGRRPGAPAADTADTRRWSRLPGLELGLPFPVGHLVPQPVIDGRRADWTLPAGWAVISRAFDADMTYDHDAVLVRPDRYIAAAGTVEHVSAAGRPWGATTVEREAPTAASR
ncbi:MAG: FAD-dependent monooxygenase [Ilumatobacteraceae bacterium]